MKLAHQLETLAGVLRDNCDPHVDHNWSATEVGSVLGPTSGYGASVPGQNDGVYVGNVYVCPNAEYASLVRAIASI